MRITKITLIGGVYGKRVDISKTNKGITLKYWDGKWSRGQAKMTNEFLNDDHAVYKIAAEVQRFIDNVRGTGSDIQEVKTELQRFAN